MVKQTLHGRRVLVAEDEYMLAAELQRELEDIGAEVLGPVPTVKAALALLKAHDRIDAAIVDINLRGEFVFPVIDVLLERDVPLVFATGYDASVIPARFKHIARCEKPVDFASILNALQCALHAQRPTAVSRVGKPGVSTRPANKPPASGC